MIITTRVCDECGAPATWSTAGMTGRVLIDGVDNNRQASDLCDAHKPTREDPWHPHNCSHVVFFWPGRPPGIGKLVNTQEHELIRYIAGRGMGQFEKY